MLPDGRRTNATPPAIRVPESSRASSPPPLRGHRSLAALSLHSTPADGSEYWGEESDSHALNPFWGLISTEASPTHRPQVTTTDNLKACRGCYGQDKRLDKVFQFLRKNQLKPTVRHGQCLYYYQEISTIDCFYNVINMETVFWNIVVR
jgi:hypothetical protein